MIGSVSGLTAPDGDQCVAVDAGQAFDAFERRFVLGQKLATLHGELIEIILRQIVGGGFCEFRLPVVVDLRPAGKIEIGNRVVGLDAGEGCVEGFARDPWALASGQRLSTKA